MAHYDLNELEADEVFHALVERKGTLEARVKSLGEKDGLPEAADAVRKRIALYMPTGEAKGDDYRPGLVRLFAPQRELDAERDEQRRDEERDAAGQQDIFGGGAETGGRKRKKAAAETPAEPPAPPAESTEEPSTPPAPADPVELALEQLASLAADLLAAEATMEPDVYRGYAVPVLELLPRINPAFDIEYLRTHINQTISGDAHALSHFVSRQVEQVRDARERPIGRREEAHAGNATPEAATETAIEDVQMPDSVLESTNVGESPEGATDGVALASDSAAESDGSPRPKRGKKR